MRAAAVAFLLAAVLAGPAAAQDSPSDVTDGEIAKYKVSAITGCRDAGKARGDPQAKIDSFCGCVLASLEKTMKRPEWQQAYYYSQRNDENEEKRVLAPHVQNLGGCLKGP